jgi:hypothetical protein
VKISHGFFHIFYPTNFLLLLCHHYFQVVCSRSTCLGILFFKQHSLMCPKLPQKMHLNPQISVLWSPPHFTHFGLKVAYFGQFVARWSFVVQIWHSLKLVVTLGIDLGLVYISVCLLKRLTNDSFNNCTCFPIAFSPTVMFSSYSSLLRG